MTGQQQAPTIVKQRHDGPIRISLWSDGVESMCVDAANVVEISRPKLDGRKTISRPPSCIDDPDDKRHNAAKSYLPRILES